MIRKALESDVDKLSELFIDVFSKPPWEETWEFAWAKERLQILFESPKFTGLLYELDGKVVGAILGRGMSFKGEKELEVVEFFVSSDIQGKGIGSQLVSQIGSTAAQQGYKYILLLTSNRVPAYSFYLNNGFYHEKKMALLVRDLTPNSEVGK